MKSSRLKVLLLLALLTGQMALAATAIGRTYEEKEWGLGMIMRGATIPFATDETRVASLVPMMWYQGKRVYFLGTEGGVMLYEKDKWRFSALGRMHFFDIPSDLGNEYQGNTSMPACRPATKFLAPPILTPR